MRDIWDAITRHPELLILVGFWLISMVGGLMTRAAKKAAKRQRSQGGQRPPSGRATEPTARTAGGERSMAPEDIARQIRRAMGLETEEPPTSPIERAPAPAVVESPPARPPALAVGEHRPGLAEELAARESREERAEQRRSEFGSGVAGRTLDHFKPHIDSAREVPDHRPMARIVDLRRPAAAIVAMELLGTPVGLRDPKSHPHHAR